MTTPFRFRQLGRHGLVYGIGMMLNKVVAFVMLPIYTRFLRPSDYGLLQLVDMALEVLSIAAGSRLAAGIFHFYHKAETEAEKRSVLSTAMLILGASYVLVSGAAYMAAPRIATLVLGGAEYADLVRLGTARLAFESLIIVPMAYLQVRDRSGAFVVANAIRMVIQMTLSIIFVVGLGYGAAGVLASGLIGTVVVGVILGVMFFRDVGLHPSKSAAGDLIRFGLPFLATQVATFIATFSDRYFLREAADAAAVGLYGLAYQFGFLLFSVAYVPFNRVWEPMRFTVAKQVDRDIIYARVFVYFNLVMVTVALGIALFVHDGLRIIADPAYHAASGLVPIILVAYLLQGWTGFHNVGLFYRERSGLITWANWAAAAVALTGYVFLIPIWYGYGAAVTTVIAFAVREIMIYAFSQRLWPVKYDWLPVVRTLLAGLVVFAVHELVPIGNLWLSLAFQSGLFVVFLGAIWFGGILSISDRQAVAAIVKSPRAGLAALRGRD